jgi:hypothetical protein
MPGKYDIRLYRHVELEERSVKRKLIRSVFAVLSHEFDVEIIAGTSTQNGPIDKLSLELVVGGWGS